MDKFGRHKFLPYGNSPRSSRSGQLYLTSRGEYDMRHRVMRNLGNPRFEKDAVTVSFLKSSCVNSLNSDNFNCGGKLIRNVGLPILFNDVATMGYVNTHALTKSDGNQYDAANYFISNVRDPLLDSDVATKKFVENSSLTMSCGGEYDARLKNIRNVADPLQPSDVVTLNYMKKFTPTPIEDHWEFLNKRLSSIANPVYPGEAVNLQTLHTLTPSIKNNEKDFNASNLKITNLGDGTLETDAANMRSVRREINDFSSTIEKHLERLGAALFNYIHFHSKSKEDSKINNRNYIDWNYVHGRAKQGGGGERKE